MVSLEKVAILWIMEKFRFPQGFYFGAATSAHQVEGGNKNDWTVFEKRHAKRQADVAKKRQWPDFILKNYPSPLQEENYISGKACDHYNRFREDFDIAKSLGHNAHRFSIEWSRIEPEEGKFDEKEIEHYREVIKALRERGMEPFVTLWHFTLPLWFVERGGWESRDAAFYFARYCGRVAEEFRSEVKFWMTENEPSPWVAQAYLYGFWPPQKLNIFSTGRVYFNLIRAHKGAYKELKRINNNFRVGIAESFEWWEPGFLRSPIHYFRNFFFLGRVRKYLDFVGINYYERMRLWGMPPGPLSDFGWEIYPMGLCDLLKKMWRKFKKPIYITENGLADARDALRAKFIEDHIFWMKKAMDEGVDIGGYFHWSLLDNFEWDSGFWPRFGLVEVDYRTMERKVRKSAKIYTEIIQNSKFKNQNDNAKFKITQLL